MDAKDALKRAQENESESLDPTVEAALQRELERVWTKIQAQPSSYTMDKTEFGVFNRYRGQVKFQNETARKAIERYWNSIKVSNSH